MEIWVPWPRGMSFSFWLPLSLHLQIPLFDIVFYTPPSMQSLARINQKDSWLFWWTLYLNVSNYCDNGLEVTCWWICNAFTLICFQVLTFLTFSCPFSYSGSCLDHLWNIFIGKTWSWLSPSCGSLFEPFHCQHHRIHQMS